MKCGEEALHFIKNIDEGKDNLRILTEYSLRFTVLKTLLTYNLFRCYTVAEAKIGRREEPKT